MDDLGNRDKVNVRDANDVDYVIDYLTNRYSKVGDANITYDQAGLYASSNSRTSPGSPTIGLPAGLVCLPICTRMTTLTGTTCGNLPTSGSMSARMIGP
jgi:hypothetical protein